MIHFDTDLTGIDWIEAAEVVRRAPLGEHTAHDLEQAFLNSYACVFAFDSTCLIGMARALCDGVAHAAIYGVVVLPEYQGRQIGRQLMEHLLEQLPVPNIILFAVPGREGFYSKLGFQKMRTAMAILCDRLSDSAMGCFEAAPQGVGRRPQSALLLRDRDDA